jgi:hypothetical protein
MLCILITLTACNRVGQTDDAKESESEEAKVTTSTQEMQTSGQQKQSDAREIALIKPEQLISKEEAESLLGVAVKAGEKTDNPPVGQKLCFYEAADESSDVFLQIAITQQAFMPEGSMNTPESIYMTTKDAFGGDSAVVEGPGDETILVSGGYYILVDGYMLQISAGSTDKETTIALLDAASVVAVNNLKAIIG